MFDLQGMFDRISEGDRKVRSKYHLTLGQAIEQLSKLSIDTPVYGLGLLSSYRGHYHDLAFEPITGTRTAAEVLWECRDALLTTFEGYKGGDYDMDEDTPLWVASYGTASGHALVGLEIEGGTVRPITKYQH